MRIVLEISTSDLVHIKILRMFFLQFNHINYALRMGVILN